jgi:hypothetical protein
MSLPGEGSLRGGGFAEHLLTESTQFGESSWRAISARIQSNQPYSPEMRYTGNPDRTPS